MAAGSPGASATWNEEDTNTGKQGNHGNTHGASPPAAAPNASITGASCSAVQLYDGTITTRQPPSDNAHKRRETVESLGQLVHTRALNHPHQKSCKLRVFSARALLVRGGGVGGRFPSSVIHVHKRTKRVLCSVLLDLRAGPKTKRNIQ